MVKLLEPSQDFQAPLVRAGTRRAGIVRNEQKNLAHHEAVLGRRYFGPLRRLKIAPGPTSLQIGTPPGVVRCAHPAFESLPTLSRKQPAKKAIKSQVHDRLQGLVSPLHVSL